MSCIRLICLIFILIGLAYAEHDCSKYFLGLKQRLQQLNILDEYGAKIKISRVEMTENQFKVFDQNENYVLVFDYAVEDDLLRIGLIDVPRYKGQKIASTSYEYLLDFNPEIKSIRSLLSSDNHLAFIKAKRLGLSNEEAIKLTPAYKIRNNLRFGKIDLEKSRFKFKDDGKVSYIILVTQKNRPIVKKTTNPLLMLSKEQLN